VSTTGDDESKTEKKKKRRRREKEEEVTPESHSPLRAALRRVKLAPAAHGRAALHVVEPRCHELPLVKRPPVLLVKLGLLLVQHLDQVPVGCGKVKNNKATIVRKKK
jgi:hypothetical protein